VAEVVVLDTLVAEVLEDIGPLVMDHLHYKALL
jgi:hypothetical protein